MILILKFHDMLEQLKLQAVIHVAIDKDPTPVNEVRFLKDPDFEILPQARPGRTHKRDKFVPETVCQDSTLRVRWKKFYNKKTGLPYKNAMWIYRRVKELEEMGWEVTLV